MTQHARNRAALRQRLLNMTDHSAYGAGGRALPVAVRGDGAFVELADGRRYIDGLSSMFCNQLGHAYAGEIADVAARQLRELPRRRWLPPSRMPSHDRTLTVLEAPRGPSRLTTQGDPA